MSSFDTAESRADWLSVRKVRAADMRRGVGISGLQRAAATKVCYVGGEGGLNSRNPLEKLDNFWRRPKSSR